MGDMESSMGLLLSLLIAIVAGAKADSWDLRLHPACGTLLGQAPTAQGRCNSCVAAAVATVLTVKACLIGKPPLATSFFSPQQIWDCYGGSCAVGVNSDLMHSFFPAVINGPQAGRMLLPLPNSSSAPMAEANFSRCLLHTADGTAALSSVALHSTLAGNTTSASQDLKTYLKQHGPAMAVVTMTAQAFDSFTLSTNNASLFRYTQAVQQGGMVKHALVVIGWQEDAWLVQNSMGDSWGMYGVGLMEGPLETQWYALDLGLPSQIEDVPFFLPPLLLQPPQNQKLDTIIFLITLMSMLSLALVFYALPSPKRTDSTFYM
jgi:hypothetical protein